MLLVIILRRVITFFFVQIIYIMLSRNGYYVRFFTVFLSLSFTFAFFPVFWILWKKVHLFPDVRQKDWAWFDFLQISVESGFKVCRFLLTFWGFANVGKTSFDFRRYLLKWNTFSVTPTKRYCRFADFCKGAKQNKEWKIKVSLTFRCAKVY